MIKKPRLQILLLLMVLSCQEKVIELDPVAPYQFQRETDFNFITEGIHLSDGGMAIIGQAGNTPMLMVLNADFSLRFKIVVHGIFPW